MLLKALAASGHVGMIRASLTITMHRAHPVIDRIFPFAEVKEAYRHFESRGHFGKVVIAHG